MNEIIEGNETIMNVIKTSISHDYEKYVMKKLLKEKKNYIKKWMARSDYEAILFVQSYK